MAWTLPDDAVLGIFVEKPRSALAAPALADELGLDRATEIQEAMLFDVLDLWDSPEILTPGGRRVLVYGPSDAGPWFDERVPASFALQPQTDGDRGRGIHDFLNGELEEAGRVVAIGSNVPTLDPSIVISAFLCLEGRDLVLGPATGGGYYLVGARRPVPPIFDGVDSNDPAGLNEIVNRLAETGLSLSVLPPWYAVETGDEFRMFAGHLRAMRRAGCDPGLPRLERLIERLRLENEV